MTPTITVTAETAASLWSQQRSLLILPFSSWRSQQLANRILMVAEPFDIAPTGGVLYAGDYPHSYGWKPATAMTDELCRMWIEVKRVRLVYEHSLNESDLLADGVHRVGTKFAWQRRAEVILEYDTAAEAWKASLAASFGHVSPGNRDWKFLLANISVLAHYGDGLERMEQVARGG